MPDPTNTPPPPPAPATTAAPAPTTNQTSTTKDPAPAISSPVPSSSPTSATSTSIESTASLLSQAIATVIRSLPNQPNPAKTAHLAFLIAFGFLTAGILILVGLHNNVPTVIYTMDGGLLVGAGVAAPTTS